MTTAMSPRAASAPITAAPKGQYIVASTSPIAPGAVGPVPHRVRRACRVVDVTVLGEFKIIRVSFSKALLELEPGETVAERLAKEPYDASANSFMVATVQNRGGAAAVAEVIVHVDHEHGPEAEGSGLGVFRPAKMNGAFAADGSPMPYEPMPMEPAPPSTSGRVRPSGSAATAKSEATVSSTVPKRASPAAPPAVKAVPKATTKQAPPSAAVIATEEIVTTEVKPTMVLRGATAPPPLLPSRSRVRIPSRPKRTILRGKKRPMAATAVRAATANTGTTVVVLFRGFADALHASLAWKVPLPPTYRSPIGGAFQAAATRTMPAGANEVAVELDASDADALGQAIWTHGEVFLENAPAIAEAIAHALGHDEASASESSASEIPAEVASADEPVLTEDDDTASEAALTTESEHEVEASTGSDTLTNAQKMTEPETNAEALATVLPLTPRHPPDDGRPE